MAHAKLQWWESELRRFMAGQARHPITQALDASASATGHAGAAVRTLCTGLGRIIDREIDVATTESWLAEAQVIGGGYADLENHYLQGQFDVELSRQLGGYAEAARWCFQAEQAWLSAPADLRAKFQVSNAMLHNDQQRAQVSELQSWLRRDLTSKTRTLLDAASANGAGLAPSLVIATKLALSADAASPTGVKAQLRPFVWLFQAWGGARLASRTPWQPDD